MILREQRNAETAEGQSNNSAVIKQSLSSSSKDTHNNVSLSSSGTKALTQVEDSEPGGARLSLERHLEQHPCLLPSLPSCSTPGPLLASPESIFTFFTRMVGAPLADEPSPPTEVPQPQETAGI